MTHPPAYVRDDDGIVHRLIGDDPACGAVVIGSHLAYLASIEDVDEDALCLLCWLEPGTLAPVMA